MKERFVGAYEVPYMTKVQRKAIMKKFKPEGMYFEKRNQ